MTASNSTSTTAHRPAYPAYPVPRLEECDDRFSPELIADVGWVIRRHGFPVVDDLRDQSALGMHLYRFFYGER
ncbi:hypothetical protein [Streptomyces benahoarensis]|uniref:Uncharacterized protein n=1 Tax=Streptomyces benahoarensis TaxID=2595054 RepID=A0A553YA11_9ACTN|nr:hypothetical protein [Streptomyces benahoarensis]TSB17710.1 hypothetical protein FNJ62_26725 [Streptomyces benahoarensis]TSB25863.1 hypothetical protein FNZ23_26875 [Streptomyces benahoarensis]